MKFNRRAGGIASGLPFKSQISDFKFERRMREKDEQDKNDISDKVVSRVA
jgi:hypothetical protein